MSDELHILEGLRDADRGDVVIYAQWELGPALELIWQEPEPAQPAFSRRQSLDRVAGSESASLPVKTLDLHHGLDYSVQASNLAEVDLDGEDERSWSIAFTKGFRKSLAVLDRKLQGRLLLALSEISQNPNALHGDTQKPLAGSFKGLWRYRVGDYRLLYQARTDTLTVVMLDIRARGGAYD